MVMRRRTIRFRAKRRPVRFIAQAIKRPGALTAKAQRAGALTERGTIQESFLREQAKMPGRTGRQARFALLLRGFNKK